MAIITDSVALAATPEAVWSVLTQPEHTVKYMYNCTVNSTWEIDSPVIWEGEYQGYQAFQKGKVLSFIPNQTLSYSTFDPNIGLPDIPESYIHVTYALFPYHQSTILTVINETFDGNTERLTHIEQVWQHVLSEISRIFNG